MPRPASLDVSTEKGKPKVADDFASGIASNQPTYISRSSTAVDILHSRPYQIFRRSHDSRDNSVQELTCDVDVSCRGCLRGGVGMSLYGAPKKLVPERSQPHNWANMMHMMVKKKDPRRLEWLSSLADNWTNSPFSALPYLPLNNLVEGETSEKHSHESLSLTGSHS